MINRFCTRVLIRSLPNSVKQPKPGLTSIMAMSKLVEAMINGEDLPVLESDLRPDRLIWIDCEMTGLDVEHHALVEIACIVTEGHRELTTLGDGVQCVIKQPPATLDSMSDWCKVQFAKNGLLDRIKSSKTSMSEAEHLVLSYIQTHTDKGVCPLAGNTVSMDRRFIDKYMPKLAQHLHYRTVDVSSVKELCRRWYPDVFRQLPPKSLNHRALDDIRESIAELRWYQKNIMIPERNC